MLPIARTLRSILCMFTLIIVGLLPGCISVETTAPLVDPQRATIDGKLLGTWAHTEFDDKTQRNKMTTFQFKRSDRTTDPPGIMTMGLDDKDIDASAISEKDKIGASLYFVTCTVPSPGAVSNSYVSWFERSKDGRTDLTDSTQCMVFSYRVSGNTLSLYLPSTSVGEELVNNGTIAGTLQKDEKDHLKSIIFERDSLLKYLQKNEADKLFPTSTHVDYQLVSGTESPDPSVPVVLSPPKASAVSLPSTQTTTTTTPTPTPNNGQPITPTQQAPQWQVVLPWMILVFLGGVFAARKFSKQ